MLDDHGLGVSGMAADFGKVPPTLAKPAGLHRRGHAAPGHLPRSWGSNKLRTDTIGPPTEIPGGMDYETCFWRMAQAFRRRPKSAPTRASSSSGSSSRASSSTSPARSCAWCYAVDHPNFSVLFDSCHAHMCAVVGARQMGEKETLPGGVVQFAHMLTGKIGHVHFIDSDETLHDDDTSTHAPFGQGVLDFRVHHPGALTTPATTMNGGRWTCASGPSALEATEPGEEVHGGPGREVRVRGS